MVFSCPLSPLYKRCCQGIDANRDHCELWATRTSTVLFWVLATLVGTVQGGIQALSRSYFGQIIPPERSNEYFGFLDIFGKFSCVIGPALYSLVYTLTNRASLGILSIILLFLCGGVALLVGRKHVFAPHAMEAMKG